jgi:hypothetical protein
MTTWWKLYIYDHDTNGTSAPIHYDRVDGDYHVAVEEIHRRYGRGVWPSESHTVIMYPDGVLDNDCCRVRVAPYEPRGERLVDRHGNVWSSDTLRERGQRIDDSGYLVSRYGD